VVLILKIIVNYSKW